MKKNLKLRDYHKYQWTKEELIIETGKAVVVVGVLAFFFYRSVWAMIPLSMVGYLFFRMEEQKKRERCKEELGTQFKECILSVAASMQAGYAVENAFLESRNDMRLLYGDDSLIFAELENIRRNLMSNKADLAKRSDNEDILQFSQVFAIAKRGGGNLAEIIRSTVDLIGQRIDAKKEIATVLSGRKLEQMIMKCMPFGILLYIGMSYPGYFDDLYHNIQGVGIMTVCMIVYLAAYAMGDRILRKIALEMG